MTSNRTAPLQVALGDVCVLRAGAAFKPALQGRTAGEFPFIKVSDFNVAQNAIRIYGANNWVDREVLGSIAGEPFNAGTTVFAKIGEALKHNRVRFLTRPTYIDNNLMGATPRRDLIDPSYLFQFLRTVDFAATNAGTAVPYLTAGNLSRIPVPLPALDVQRRIASILGAYDDLIEVNRRRIAVLEEMARRLFEEWFVHFRFPVHESKTSHHPLDRASHLPAGWELVPFQSLLESWRGGDWGEDALTATETEPVFVVRGTDMDDLAQGTGNRAPARFIDRKSLEKRRLKPLDLVVENSINAKSRCAGKTLLVTPGVLKRLGGDSIAASFCKVFRFHAPELAPIAHLQMRRLVETGDMALFQNVAANGIANFQAQRFVAAQALALPADLALRKRMLGTISAFTSSTFADAISRLQASRDLLLPRLISGDLPVTAAEREPEAVA